MYFFLITIVFSTETKFTYSVGDAPSSLKTKTFELKHNMWSSARLHQSVGTGNFSAILSARKQFLTIAPNSIHIACPTVTPQSWTQHIGMALLNFQLLRRYYQMYIWVNLHQIYIKTYSLLLQHLISVVLQIKITSTVTTLRFQFIAIAIFCFAIVIPLQSVSLDI